MLKQTALFIAIHCLFSIQYSLGQAALSDSIEKLIRQHGINDTVTVNLLNELADTYSTSNRDKMRSYAEQAGELAEKLNFENGKLESILLIGKSYMASDKNNALAHYQRALETARKSDNKIGIINSLKEIGNTYKYSGHDSLVVDYYRQALKIARDNRHSKEEASCINDLALIYFEQEKIELAIDGYQKAIQLFEKLGDKKHLSSALVRLGTLYATHGNPPKALECFEKCLIISEDLKHKVGVFVSFLNIGNIYSGQKNYEKSTEYLTKALEKAEELKDKSRITACQLNIGSNFLMKNNPVALGYFQKALINAQELQDGYLQKSSLDKIGNYYEKQNDLEKALDYYKLSIKVSEDNGLKNQECLTLYFVGNIYIKQKKYSEALTYSLKGLEIASDLRLITNQSDLYKQLSEIYAARNDFKKAYANFKRYKDLCDTLYNETNVKKIAELEAKYKYENETQALELQQQKKDAVQLAEIRLQRIIVVSLVVALALMSLLAVYIYRSYRSKKQTNLLLTLQNKEIEDKNRELVQLNKEILDQKEEIITISNEVEVQNIKLQEMNATKDKFFGIIAHDLKNPFNAILGLSQILLANTESGNQQAETMEYIGVMHSSAQNAYKLLENLLEWSRSQTGTIQFNPECVNFKNLVIENEKLCANLAGEKNITLNHVIRDNMMVYADRNMLTAVVRNLVTNAIKFTHKGGTVSVESDLNGNNIVVVVADTGIGMDEATKNKLFKINEKITIVGTEQETGTGLGLLLCKEFVVQHGGRIWVESELGKGSKFKFSMPMQPESNIPVG